MSLAMRIDLMAGAGLSLAPVGVAPEPTILVFDSGLGGLTVLEAVRRARPDARYVYAADDAAFPYGRLSEADLVARVLDVMGQLIAAHRPDLVVIACNTASTLVLPALRQRFTTPFVGVVPPIKPAAATTNSAPTDPAYAWGQDPESVRAAGGTWPTGVFDDNYYSASDPVAGAGGTDPTPAVSMTNAMAAERPVFTLLAGDICYADPSGTGLPADDSGALLSTAPAGKNSYNPYVWDVFFNQIEAQAAYAPWMFATGNHDMEPLYGNTNYLGDSNHHGYGGHLKRLDLPRNGPHTCPSVYSFIYGNVGVIAVDANDLSYEIQTNTGYSGGAQLRWLKRTLKEWRTNPLVAPRIDFVVVFFHHCAYSTTNNHASDGGVRGALDPLFTQYQVDLVLQGHNHLMERTDPIKNGVPTRPAPDQSIVEPAKDGVTYLCIGSGGRPRYPFRPAPSATAPPPAGVTPTGAQALPEGQRYRGYNPPGGPNATENNTENVVNSYVWTDAGTAVGSGGYPAGSKVPEQVTWSQVRYDDYAFVAVDVDPARPGHTTTMTVRTLADALPGSGERTTEIDRIVLKRKAGRAAKTI